MGIANCLNILKKAKPKHMISGGEAAELKILRYKIGGEDRIATISSRNIWFRTTHLFKGAAIAIKQLLMLGV